MENLAKFVRWGINLPRATQLKYAQSYLNEKEIEAWDEFGMFGRFTTSMPITTEAQDLLGGTKTISKVRAFVVKPLILPIDIEVGRSLDKCCERYGVFWFTKERNAENVFSYQRVDDYRSIHSFGGTTDDVFHMEMGLNVLRDEFNAQVNLNRGVEVFPWRAWGMKADGVNRHYCALMLYLQHIKRAQEPKPLLVDSGLKINQKGEVEHV